MRFIMILAGVLLAAGACKTGSDYQCVCKDNGGTYGDQQYTIKSDDHGVASYECEKYNISLNSGGSSYSCTLY